MRRIRTIAIVLLILGGFGLLVGKRMEQRKAEQAKLDQIKPAPMQVEGVHPLRTTLRATFKSPGTVTAKAEVPVVPKANGRIASLLVDEGSYVSAGQLLAEIEHHELKAQLAQAQAAIAGARSAMAQARVNAANANSDEARMKGLYEQEAISAQQWEAVQLKAKVAREQITASDAQLAQAQATVRVIEAQIVNCRVTAPISGQVVKRHVDLGTMTSGMAPIVTLAQTGSLRAEFDLPERQLGQLKLHQGVMVAALADPAAPVRATISEISPVVDPQTRLVKVKVALPAGGIFRPGMSVEGQFILAEKAEALTVPLGAVATTAGRSVVFVDDNGKVAEREIQTGIRSLEAVEILAGLNPADRVIVVGQSFVKAGDEVSLVLKAGKSDAQAVPQSSADGAPVQKGA